jgi:hypothetical protein
MIGGYAIRGLLKAELLKLKHSWLLKLSFVLALFFPLLTLLMTSVGGLVSQSAEPRVLQLLRQNHIFLTLLMGNLFFPLMAIDLFYKEFNLGTIADIISVPVPRIRFLLIKEAVLFGWMVFLSLISYLVCLIMGVVFMPDGLSLDIAWSGLWRYAAATVILFIPLQLSIWITLAFKSYVVSLGVSIAAVVGTVIAYNTTTLIFFYPFSIGFVLTNFKETISTGQITISLVSLSLMAVICLLGIGIRFRRMDI